MLLCPCENLGEARPCRHNELALGKWYEDLADAILAAARSNERNVYRRQHGAFAKLRSYGPVRWFSTAANRGASAVPAVGAAGAVAQSFERWQRLELEFI